jgi:hypothetical protein
MQQSTYIERCVLFPIFQRLLSVLFRVVFGEDVVRNEYFPKLNMLVCTNEKSYEKTSIQSPFANTFGTRQHVLSSASPALLDA